VQRSGSSIARRTIFTPARGSGVLWEQRHAAAGYDALLDRRPRRVKRVRNAALLGS
jgi:hypothetical protein